MSEQHNTPEPVGRMPEASAPAQNIHITNHVTVVQQKSTVVAYVLWFFLGMLGVHKFYLKQSGQGAVYLILSLIGWSTAFILIGWFFLAVVWVGLLIDLFTMPGRVSKLNTPNKVQNVNYPG